MRHARIAAHVHSDWSYDGQWSLDRISIEFARRGYEAVLLAEHDRGFDSARWDDYRATCAHLRGSGSLLIPGIEYSDASNGVHVPVWGDIPFLGEGLDTAELLQRVHESGGLAVLAHPSRRDVLTQFDPELLRFLIGIELWNRKYDGYAPNGEVAQILRTRPNLIPLVSLDFHTARQFHPLAMLVALDGDLTEDSICLALEQRRTRAMAFGLPATRLAQGPSWRGLRGVELARKHLAARLRPLIQR